MPPSPHAPPVHARSHVPRALVSPFGTAVVCACAALVLLVLVAVRWSPLMTLDRTVAVALHRRALTEPALVRANRILTDWVWDPWTMRALVTVAVVVLWWRGARALAVWVTVTTVLSALLQQGIKAAVGRERPQWPHPVDSADYAAFPSGHAMSATVTCGLLLWLLRRHGAGRRVWWPALVAASVSVVGVGLTRLYLGVHWPSDVLGGWLLGAALVGFTIAGFSRYERRGSPALPRRS